MHSGAPHWSMQLKCFENLEPTQYNLSGRYWNFQWGGSHKSNSTEEIAILFWTILFSCEDDEWMNVPKYLHNVVINKVFLQIKSAMFKSAMFNKNDILVISHTF